MYIGLGKLIDKTPRDEYNRYIALQGISWGAVYPRFTNLAVIGESSSKPRLELCIALTFIVAISYSCIAPVILGFSSAGLYFLYLSYRYHFLYVIQPRVDTKGECYARAMQQLLTGVYLSELCLIGLFGTRKAKGPLVMIVILLISTVLYHIIMNRALNPLEEYLPSTLQAEDEDRPLLEAEEGTSQDDNHADGVEPASRIQKLAKGRMPDKVVNPIAKFFEPHIFASHQALKPLLREDPDTEEEEIPQYTEEDVRTAYLNPALTSEVPKLWLVKDEMGISEREVNENDAAGIPSSDAGASLDQNNKIQWEEEDLEDVPIYKKPVPY